MKRKLLMTVATGLWISGALNYGAPINTAFSQNERSIIETIPTHLRGKKWESPMWERPNIEIQSQNSEVTISTKTLTPKQVYDFSIYIKDQDRNKALGVFVLDGLLESFLEGYDDALIQLHQYADDQPNYPYRTFAQNILGLIYGIGAKVPKDDNKATIYFSAAKQRGFDQSLINLVLIRTESTQDETLLLKDQARKEDREAAFLLYKLSQEPYKKLAYLEESVRLEHPKAQFLTAEHVLNTNTPLARHLYEQSAQQGYAASLTKLALIYHTGNCVQADQNKVNEYNEEYAQQAKLFNARNANGVNDLVLREANEYPSIREFPLTPWMLSSLRSYKGDIHHLQKALPTLHEIFQSFIETQRRFGLFNPDPVPGVSEARHNAKASSTTSSPQVDPPKYEDIIRSNNVNSSATGASTTTAQPAQNQRQEAPGNVNGDREHEHGHGHWRRHGHGHGHGHGGHHHGHGHGHSHGGHRHHHRRGGWLWG